LSVRERTGRHAERGGKDGWRGWFEPGWVPQRLRVPLSTLMDEKGALARGCVLLGFLPDGNHLLAYTCRVQSGGDEGAHQDEGGRYTYTLQRWLFVDHRTPLRLVEEQALFVFGGGGDGGDDGGVSAVSGFLRLSFTLTQDNVMIVHGYVAGDKQLASPHINYVSILPFYIDASPGGNSQPLKAQGSHFKYSVHSSLCKYEPRLSFMPPKYLLLNTGCSIRYIEWEIQETPQRACLRLRQQMELDVEAHLGRMIQTNPALRSCVLIDYEVDIGHMMVDSGRALVLVCALFAVKHDPRILYCFVFSFALNCVSGGVQLLNVQPAPCSHLAKTNGEAFVRQTNQKHLQSLYQEWGRVPGSPQFHSWTNNSVLSGKSLESIYHPFYPLALQNV